jgi:NADH-quinone oxidoreductase subunit J
MEPIQVVFLLGAAIILVSAVMVVSRRNLIHAALAFIVSLFGVAMIFVLLQAYYWAVIQVVVYIGAIAIMMIMAIMVTRDVTGETVEAFNKNLILAVFLGLLAAGALIWSLSGWQAFTAAAPSADTGEVVVQALGEQMFSAQGYLLPTLLASVLLLAALVAAIKIAFPSQQEEEQK